jgi:sterol desaturase/sphingolipid hydroxylase (fatty acid hydroxylase superfamily)
MEPLLESLFGALRKPLDALFGSEQRIFLPFLATSGLIAAIVWAVAVRPRGRTSLLGFLFPRRVWLHRSAILDYQVLFVRAVMSLVLFVPAFLSTIAIAVWIARTMRLTLGLHQPSGVSGFTIAVLFTLAAFVVDDLTRFIVHVLMHRIPVLWELHKVHHSAEVLTPFTLQRVHPLEGFFMAVRGAVTLGVVTGVFIWLFPGRVRGFHVLGADAIGFTFAAIGANLRHSHVWLSYGRVLERFAISPAQHQIHHSADPSHYNRNYGASLALWDWMFRSLYLTSRYERLSFGLPASEKNHRDTVVSVVIDPLLAIARRVASRFSRSPRALPESPRAAEPPPI